MFQGIYSNGTVGSLDQEAESLDHSQANRGRIIQWDAGIRTKSHSVCHSAAGQVKGYRYLEEDNSDESDSERSGEEENDEEELLVEEEQEGGRGAEGWDRGSQGSGSPGGRMGGRQRRRESQGPRAEREGRDEAWGYDDDLKMCIRDIVSLWEGITDDNVLHLTLHSLFDMVWASITFE